jgi:RND family efflux transporter MFP subunit
MNPFPLKRTLLVLLAVSLAAGAYFVISAKRAPQGAAPAPAAAPGRPALTVSVARTQTVQLPIRLAANGNIAAWQEALVGAESNGLRLSQLLVNVGDRVSAGQTLAVFASDSVQADVAQARASLLEAQANAAEAVSNAERARTLQGSGALSAQQISQYAASAQAAEARVAAARAALKVQELRAQQTTVLAPDAGIISARSATLGAVVGTGTELFRLIRQGRLEWRAEVTSAELARLRPGMRVSVQPVAGGELQGRVRMIAPTVDPQTRSALVYVDLPVQPQMQARPGMFARGEFDLGSSSAQTIAQRALVVRDGFNYVFELGPDQRVRQRKVQTGRLVGEQVELLSGLTPDASIVVSGAGFLNDGDLVRVAEATPSAASPAASSPAPVPTPAAAPAAPAGKAGAKP